MIVVDVDTFNVCFRYLPENIDGKLMPQEKDGILGKVIVLAKKYMIEEGKVMIGYSNIKRGPYFWRYVSSNPFICEEDILY